MQTRLADRVFDALEKNLNGDISVSGIHVIPFNAVKITDLTVRDRSPYTEDKYSKGFAPVDTVFYFRKIVATMSPAGLIKGEGLHIGRLLIDGARIHLATEPDGEFLSNIARFFKIKPKDFSTPGTEKKPDKENILDVRKVTIRDFNFRHTAFVKKKREYRGIGINWQDLDARIELLKGHDFRIGGGYFSGVADKIVNLSEKSGYLASLVKGKAKVGHGLTLIEDIHVIDRWSDVRGDRYSMSYEFGDASFKHYETLVTMEARFRKSHFSVRTLGCFIDGLENLDFALDINSGRIIGPMKNLNFEKFDFASEELGLKGTLDGNLKGLSQVQEIVADLQLNNFEYRFNNRAIGFRGSIKGPIDKLFADVSAHDGNGSADIAVKVSNLQNGEPLTLDGKLDARGIDVSSYAGKSPVGKITAKTGFSAVFNKGHRFVRVDSLRAESLSLKGYEYRNLTLDGSLDDSVLEAEATCADSNAIFSIKGTYNLNKKAENAVYRAKAEVKRFDIAATGFYSKKDKAVVSLKAEGEFNRENRDEMKGGFNLKDIRFDDGNGEHCFGDIAVQGSRVHGLTTLSLDSRLLNGDYTWDNVVGRADIDFHDTRDLLAYFLPGLYIADGTRLSVALDEEGLGGLHVTSPRLAKGGMSLKDLDLDAMGKILLPSQTGGSWIFNNFLLSNGDQSILLDGRMSGNGKDTLDIRLANIDLSILDEISARSRDFNCIVSGNAELISPFSGKRPAINADIHCDSLSIKGRDQGGIVLTSRWEENDGSLQLSLSQAGEGQDAVTASGSLNPVSGDIDALAVIKGLDLSILHPFISDAVKEIDGSLNGEFAVTGSLSSPVISSRDARIEGAVIKPAVNGVSYYLDGPFSIDHQGIDFSGLSITDGGIGRTNVEGKLSYDRFKDAALDLNLNLDNMLLLDLPSGNGASLSGRVAASGFANLSGRLNSLKIAADVATAGQGSLNLMLGQGIEATTTNLLTFVSADTVSNSDPYDEILRSLKGKEKSSFGSGISIQASLHVLPDLLTRLDIDQASGSGLSARGNGLINISTKPEVKRVDLSGGYDIASGDFRFSIPGIVTKDFSITEGSSIKFGGDLMDSQLDINAKYRTRASLSTLIQSDSTSANTRRVVECGINISDKLSNPNLNLSIDIADLDPATKARVDAALSTEDKMQKQFVSLLILGTFMPDDPSGIVNGGNMILSNMGEILSSQFSKILQRLDIPLDLGFKYQQNANSRTDLFDVAISTQLFNDRVYVSGNVGNRKYGSANPNGELMGDINIEIKLDDPGQLRLNLFSRSADEYTSNLDLSQRNGVGLSYQKEYSSFRELLKSIFMTRSKREEAASAKTKARKKNTVITIGKDE